jgi:short-subunit dehydrogenase
MSRAARSRAGPSGPIVCAAQLWGIRTSPERQSKGAKVTEGIQGKPLAVITGASSGIGYELARIFGEEGYDLLLAAEDGELTQAQEQLTATGATVEAHRVDLAKEEGVFELYSHIANAGRPVEVLALNAGIGAGGAFATETELADELQLIERNAGKVLFTSSIASTMPGAFQAVYNASKSFVQSFALAIRNELKDTEVTITSVMPGPTETEFFERAGLEETTVGSEEKDDPAEVARQGFDALMAGRERSSAAPSRTNCRRLPAR